jgi:hypothetical protein
VDLLVEAEEGCVDCAFDGGGEDQADGVVEGEVLLESAGLVFAGVGELGVEKGVAFGGDVVVALGVADEVHSGWHGKRYFGGKGVTV